MLPAILIMTYPLVSSMKLKQQTSSTQQQISEQPWVDCPDGFSSPHQQAMLTRPNPPTPEAVAKAQFVDKTYVWAGK